MCISVRIWHCQQGRSCYFIMADGTHNQFIFDFHNGENLDQIPYPRRILHRGPFGRYEVEAKLPTSGSYEKARPLVMRKHVLRIGSPTS